MHRTDIYYRIPTLSNESLIHEEQYYRHIIERRECNGSFNYNERIHIKICLEMYHRGIKPNIQEEVHK